MTECKYCHTGVPCKSYDDIGFVRVTVLVNAPTALLGRLRSLGHVNREERDWTYYLDSEPAIDAVHQAAEQIGAHLRDLAGYPKCVHRGCRQHWVDTGDGSCDQGCWHHDYLSFCSQCDPASYG